MNNIPRQKIQELMVKLGHSLLDNPKQLESILQDTCGAYQREVFVLLGAVKEQVPHALLNSQNSVPRQLLLGQLTQRLQDHLGFEESAAQWAVESWALALGVASNPVLGDKDRSSSSIQKSFITEDIVLDSSQNRSNSQYSTLGKRFLAFLLDIVILYIFVIGIAFIAGDAYYVILETNEGADALGFAIGITVSWLYYALQESSAKQATLGKQAFKLIVTDRNRKRISFSRATTRHFAKWLSSFMLIGYILAVFTKRKQALHDILADCLVVRR